MVKTLLVNWMVMNSVNRQTYIVMGQESDSQLSAGQWDVEESKDMVNKSASHNESG